MERIAEKVRLAAAEEVAAMLAAGQPKPGLATVWWGRTRLRRFYVSSKQKAAPKLAWNPLASNYQRLPARE